jgi:hypothetical protein
VTEPQRAAGPLHMWAGTNTMSTHRLGAPGRECRSAKNSLSNYGTQAVFPMPRLQDPGSRLEVYSSPSPRKVKRYSSPVVPGAILARRRPVRRSSGFTPRASWVWIRESWFEPRRDNLKGVNQ